jgi:HsdM N-terminal domain
MLTGQLRSQIDKIWDAFWSGGISNPLEVIEQITYLLFLRRLDDLETLEENKAARLGEPMARRFYAADQDALGRPYEQLRWSRFKNEAPAEMFVIVRDSVFPFLRTLGADDSTYAHHMKDARFTIPTPALLAKVVDLLDDVPMARGPELAILAGGGDLAEHVDRDQTDRHTRARMYPELVLDADSRQVARACRAPAVVWVPQGGNQRLCERHMRRVAKARHQPPETWPDRDSRDA